MIPMNYPGQQETTPLRMNFTASAITYPHPVVRPPLRKPLALRWKIMRVVFSMPFLSFVLLVLIFSFAGIMMVQQDASLSPTTRSAVVFHGSQTGVIRALVAVHMDNTLVYDIYLDTDVTGRYVVSAAHAGILHRGEHVTLFWSSKTGTTYEVSQVIH